MSVVANIAVAAAEEGVHHDNGFLLAGDIKEVYWGSAAFAVLFVLGFWKLKPIIKNALNNRTEQIRTELADAEQKRLEAESSLNSSSNALPDIGQERSRIRREAIETSENLKKELAEKAKHDAQAIMAKGHSDIENMKRQAASELSAEISSLTHKTAEAVVVNDLDDRSQSQLIDSYIDGLGQLV